MTHTHHKQVGQHRDAHGFFTTVLVPTDLMLAQAQARFECPVQQLHLPDIMPPIAEAFTRTTVYIPQIIWPALLIGVPCLHDPHACGASAWSLGMVRAGGYRGSGHLRWYARRRRKRSISSASAH